MPLLEVTVYADDGAADGHLLVQAPMQPTNPYSTAPMLFLCDTPKHSAIAAGNGHAALMNPSDADIAPACPDLPVAAERRTWSGMKSLYR